MGFSGLLNMLCVAMQLNMLSIVKQLLLPYEPSRLTVTRVLTSFTWLHKCMALV